jgi:hypothetical protein
VRIFVVAEDPNEKGDLFTDRMKDLVHALGYETQYVNVHKPGRELDIHAKHRVEDRRLVAECKAQAAPVSVADLNKFAGALQAEKENDQEITGYFISLSGFRDSAMVQESQFVKRRFETLGPAQIAQQLIEGRVIVNPAVASFAAAKLPMHTSEFDVGSDPDLVMHRTGWIWAVPFIRAGQILGNALVHANGQLLAASIASQVAVDMQSIDAHFTVLMPPDKIEVAEAEAENKYLEYVINEFGSLSLEGLPVDQYASASAYRLEEVYVPLYLEPSRHQFGLSPTTASSPSPTSRKRETTRLALAQILPDRGKIAILAVPGSGKSTLVRRLAVAFADPGRREQVSDSLPDKPWLPLVLRGRDIQRVGVTSILDLLYDVARRAEMDPQLHEPFRRLLDRKLQTGNALLLIDGLDEIASEADRRLFAHQLRTFISMYPTTALVITSREAGFRQVAGEVSSYCMIYDLAELNDNDIGHLIRLWYSKVLAPSQPDQANEVTQKVLSNDRVRRLAANPLLLTTLLYVQRWVGEIPKRRVLLYNRAIDLLLMTWNVEGHLPLRTEEALPQLAYLAFNMMTRKIQRISSSEAEASFMEAREAMPEVLAYSAETPREMISRIEARSSLLMLAGYGVEDGHIDAYYEFRHLAFQEYLAALAVAREWCSGSTEGTAVEVLEPHFLEPSWSEVIPLCSVLLGRRGGLLVQALVDTLDWVESSEEPYELDDIMLLAGNLESCLVDEVQLKPDQARAVLELLIGHDSLPSCRELLPGRYGPLLSDVIWSALADGIQVEEIGLDSFWLAADVVVFRARKEGLDLTRVVSELYKSKNIADNLAAMAVVGRSAYQMDGNSVDSEADLFDDSAVITAFQEKSIEILESTVIQIICLLGRALAGCYAGLIRLLALMRKRSCVSDRKSWKYSFSKLRPMAHIMRDG